MAPPHRPQTPQTFLFALSISTQPLRGRLVWSLLAPWPEARVSELAARAYAASGEAAAADAEAGRVARALETLSAHPWPSFITDVVASTPGGQVAEHPVVTRSPRPDGAWGAGPVTLVGDAAHLGSPMLAQGSAGAFEDADPAVEFGDGEWY